MKNKKHSTIWLRFGGIIFATALSVFVAISLIWFLLYTFGVVSVNPQEKRMPLFLLLCGCMLLGGSVAVYVGKVIINPIQKIGKAFNKLSEGDFTVKVSEDEPIDEIRQIARQFNAMTYDLTNIETLRTDFVANVSHEFKTPISSIEGYATLLQNPTLSPEKRMRYVEKILENSRRLSNLTSNMLLLTKLENQGMVIDNKEFRLDEQIRKNILSLEDKWSKKNIQFDMDLPQQSYYGSERLLEHVWYNVIDNAIKHSPQNGTIEIRIEQDDLFVSVEITDHGDGMTEDVMKHIFEKFYQGDPSRKEEGNGLGLALVKRILNICKCEIDVKSKIGEGTTFIIKLPKQNLPKSS